MPGNIYTRIAVAVTNDVLEQRVAVDGRPSPTNSTMRHGADLFNLAVPGNIYTRIMNPTNGSGTAGGGDGRRRRWFGTGISSQAAIHYSIVNLAEAGNNIVTVPQLYGGTWTLFRHMLPKLGIDVRFADDDSPEALAKLIDNKTSGVFCESIGNPAGNIPDLAAIADMAHAHGVPVIVDNTVPTPALCRPFEHGCDIVLHSMTKYMGGHGNSIAGILVDGGIFDWTKHAERFYMFSTPEPSYHGVVFTDAMGPAAYIARARVVALRNTGSALSPFNAFLILQGLQTLSLRMECHVDNAMAVAKHLENHSQVEWVTYAGLESSPYYDLAQKYTGGRPSGLLTFGIKGGFDAGVKFYDALQVFTRLVNIGDAKSLAAHPASTTHRQLTEEELQSAGVSGDMIRLCIGIEHIDDIIEDLEQALAAAQ